MALTKKELHVEAEKFSIDYFTTRHWEKFEILTVKGTRYLTMKGVNSGALTIVFIKISISPEYNQPTDKEKNELKNITHKHYTYTYIAEVSIKDSGEVISFSSFEI